VSNALLGRENDVADQLDSETRCQSLRRIRSPLAATYSRTRFEWRPQRFSNGWRMRWNQIEAGEQESSRCAPQRSDTRQLQVETNRL
jgi:hypothetical protein